MGDIGKTIKTIELIPAEEPSVAPAPVPVPEPEPEKVGA